MALPATIASGGIATPAEAPFLASAAAARPRGRRRRVWRSARSGLLVAPPASPFSLPVDIALLSTIASGSAEAPSLAVAALARPRRRRRVWRSSASAGRSAAPLFPSRASLLICCLAIAVIPLGRHRATRDACTTTSPAFGARQGGDPGGAVDGHSNAPLAREVERILHCDIDFSFASALPQRARKRLVCLGSAFLTTVIIRLMSRTGRRAPIPAILGAFCEADAQ
jgi:hypothetical protein